MSERRPPVDHWQERDEETAIANYLQNTNTRLIGLVGAGGYGKSALASRMMDAAINFDAQLWANFEQPVDFATFALWLLRKLMGDLAYERVRELYQTEPTEKLLEAAIARLQSGRYLLVLDNLETLQRENLWQPFQAFLEKWLDTGSTGKIILTTQVKMPLSRAEAWEWLRLEGLPIEQGVKLLESYGIVGSEADVRSFVEIADGHPLLLRIAASWLQRKAKDDSETTAIHHVRQDDLTLLREICDSHRGDPEASVGTVLDRSLVLIEPRLQVLLLRLSVLRQEFELPIAQTLLDESVGLDDLRMLARYSFVQEQRVAEIWQFTFLALIKRYLQQKAQAEGQDREAHQSAIFHFLIRIKPISSPEDCTEKLEIAYHWLELGQFAQANQMMKTCTDLLVKRGSCRDLLPIYQRLTAVWQAQSPIDPDDQHDLGEAWTTLGNLYRILGQCPAAMSAYELALSCFIEIGDYRGQGASLGGLGVVYHVLGEYAQAIDLHQQHYKIACDIDDLKGQAVCLGNLGNAYHALGRYARAIDLHQQHYKIACNVGDLQGQANALGSLGIVYSSLENYQQAVNLFRQHYKIACDVGDLQGKADALGNLGIAFCSLNNYPQGIASFQQQYEIACDIGNRRSEANAVNNLGIAHGLLGNHEQAVSACQQSLEIAREVNDRHGEASALGNLGKALILANSESNLVEVFSVLQEARAIFTELHLDHEVERCDAEIYAFNQMISTEPRQPVLGVPSRKPRTQSAANRRRLWLFLGFCVGVVGVLLVAWLRK